MRVIGHRGARGLAPENTIASLEAAIMHGADAIEIDVRVTKDGVPVLHHGKAVRDASGRLRIRTHRLAELRQHCPGLPTLAEAIAAVNRRVPLILEIKNGEPAAPIAAVIGSCLRSGWKPADLQVASFSWRVLCDVRRRLPVLPLIVSDRWSAVRAASRARRLGTRWIIMQQRWLWPGLISLLHRRQYELTAYTLNNPRRARRFARAGLYAVITDYPDRFKHRQALPASLPPGAHPPQPWHGPA